MSTIFLFYDPFYPHTAMKCTEFIIGTTDFLFYYFSSFLKINFVHFCFIVCIWQPPTTILRVFNFNMKNILTVLKLKPLIKYKETIN
jgi:hypothetical protein